MRAITLIAAAMIAAPVSSQGKALLVPLPAVPGADATFVETINNRNVIAGDYFISSGGGLHGFVGTPDGHYTTFDALNGTTFVGGLSDNGTIIGLSNVMTEECPVQGCAYLRTPNGTIKPITRRGAPLDGSPGQIVGRKSVGYFGVLDEQFETSFFGYLAKGTKYRADITLPFTTNWTMPHGYNAAGTVVGTFGDNDNGDFPGFVLKDGKATAIRYPDAQAFHTSFESIDSDGTIVGWWGDQGDTFQKAFLFDPATSRFTPIPVKGATFVRAYGINDAGIATVTADGSSYLYCRRRDRCPVTTNAIEIDDTLIPARHDKIRTMGCRTACIGPWHSDKTSDRASIQR